MVLKCDINTQIKASNKKLIRHLTFVISEAVSINKIQSFSIKDYTFLIHLNG